MKDRKYNIGLIGLGKFGRNYIHTLARFPNVNLKVACRNTDERPQFLPEGCKFTNDWEELFDYDLDGIIAVVSPDLHYQIASAACHNGVPCLIEKPACFTVKQAIHLKKLSHINKTPILVNYIHLFSEVFLKMKELIGDKNIKSITSKGCGDGPFRNFPNYYDYLPHDLVLGLYLTGKSPKLIDYIEQKCKNGGSLWEIEVDYDKIEHKMIVGNGGERKERKFDVYLKNGERLLCSGDFLLHFSDKDTLINSYHFEHDLSLGFAIQAFLNLIDGEKDDRSGIDLTLKITKILEQIENDVI